MVKLSQLILVALKLQPGIGLFELRGALENAGVIIVDDTIETGPTGEHSDGKLRDDDEGDLKLSVGLSGKNIIIDFGKSVSWIGFGAEDARKFAEFILAQAAELEGIDA